MWFERYKFKQDPYVIRDPFTVPLDLIRWDRDDLAQKENLRLFISDVASGYRVGLKIYGPSGSGKTWLLRYLQKDLVDKLGEEVALIYTKIPRGDPTFAAFYDFVVRGWTRYRDRVLEAMYREYGDQESAWQTRVGDYDMGSCLWRMKYKADEKETLRLCEHWLRGVRIPVRDLVTIGATTSLDRHHRKYFVLAKLLELCLLAFGTCVLVVDELENASGSLAGALGDSLRDLLDSFSEGFALACSYTAQVADEFIDHGYGEFLFRRLEWEVRLDPITPDAAPSFIQTHQSAYREEGYADDQLLPFAQDGLRVLLGNMEPERWYPGFIFPNCGLLARLGDRAQADRMDEGFVTEQISHNRPLFPYLAAEPRLM